MFAGFYDEGTAFNLLVQLRAGSGAPVEPDAAPRYRVYGQSGLVAGGSGSASAAEAGAVTNATNASPIVITSAGHGVTTGQAVTVSGVGGNTAANGAFVATAVDADRFSLNGSTGNGAYTSGGAWQTTGLYKVALAGGVLNGLEAGKTYLCVLTWLESAARRVERVYFTVR